MSNAPSELPAFVEELLDELPEGGGPELDALYRLVEPVSPAPALGTRLLTEVSELPLRYAPFFDRISLVWDLPVARVEAELERAKLPEAWRKTSLPGLRLMDVSGGEKVQGADVHLVRFSPGMRFPRHRHPGDEALFVLEGSYRDSSGRIVGPGDLQEMAAGTEHGFVVARGEPCFAASVQRGREFTGWLIRILSKLVP